MKKLTLIYLVILIAVYAVFSMVDQKSDYVIERKIWRANNALMEIAKDPAVIPTRNFENVINDYQEIIDQYPGSKLTPELHIRIGEVYALKEDYLKAREIFMNMKNLYPEQKELIAEALFQAGKTYEVNKQWKEAYKIYMSIVDEYPLTNTGLSVPIFIANYYRNQNDFQSTMGAYELAIHQYKKISVEQEGRSVGMKALRHLSNCYLDQNRWVDAIEAMGETLEKYASSDHLTVENIDLIIKTINITAAYQLKDYDVAITLYEGIIARNPGHPLNNYLTRVIDAFNQLKIQGVDVSTR